MTVKDIQYVKGNTYTFPKKNGTFALTSNIPDISGKQDTLTFDSTPTHNSTNPVTIGYKH